MSTPFILHIYVADGNPDGLRIVERSNWNGMALMFPRPLYPEVRKRKEFKNTGVYLLLGPREDGEGEKLYIGEGDPVLNRFESHYANRDFWTRAVFFCAGPGQLNKAHVQYLEARLINLAAKSKRMPLDNANHPTDPSLSEADLAFVEVFLQNLLGMLPVLGVHAFEQSKFAGNSMKVTLLHCKGRGVTGMGYDSPQGFVVREGSFAAINTVPSQVRHYPHVIQMRKDLIKSGVLLPEGKQYRFTQDYTFNSPSMASSIVIGRSSNGRVDWKDEHGRTLKEMQEAQAQE